MFNWRKRQSASVDPPNRDPPDLRCSFCLKSQADVRKLIAGPDVCICDECVDVCVDIMEDDDRFQEQRSSGNRPSKRFSKPAADNATQCMLCGNEGGQGEMLAVSNRGVLCGECADAVDDALSKGRPIS